MAPRRARMVALIADIPEPATEVPARPVRPDDGAALGRLAFAAYSGSVDDHGQTEAEHVEDLSATLTGRYGRLLVPASVLAERADGELDAAAIWTWVDDLPLLAFALTAPAARGRGLASALIARGARALAADGHQQVHLAVTEGNPAWALYERLGFREAPLPRR